MTAASVANNDAHEVAPESPSVGGDGGSRPGGVLSAVMESLGRLLREHSIALWLLAGFLLFSLFVILNRDLETYLRFLLLGLPMGAVVALLAIGYSMVYGIIQLINFAHGEVFMLSACFTMMFLVPGMQTPLVAGFVALALGLCVMQTAFVFLPESLSKGTRLGLGAAIGVLAAFVVRSLLPLPGGTVVLPFVGAWSLAVGLACCVGVTIDRVAYRPLRNAPRLIPLITAIGMSFLLANVAQALWGASPRSFPQGVIPEFLTTGNRVPVMGRLTVSTLDILIVAMTVSLIILMELFIGFTRSGRALRACSMDRPVASLMGINIDRTVALAFLLGAGLAAMAAPLYVLRGTNLSPTMGYIVGILAFSSAVLGGIGNLTGAMLGGLIIGMTYTFVPLFDSLDQFAIFQWMEARGMVSRQAWQGFVRSIGAPSQYQLGIAYALMILVIVLRPTGLLGKATAKRA
jgi:branched-chain amino acid transport system permease protein